MYNTVLIGGFSYRGKKTVDTCLADLVYRCKLNSRLRRKLFINPLAICEVEPSMAILGLLMLKGGKGFFRTHSIFSIAQHHDSKHLQGTAYIL